MTPDSKNYSNSFLGNVLAYLKSHKYDAEEEKLKELLCVK